MTIQAVTFDCWGTLLLDGPASDDGYGPWRLAEVDKVLRNSGIEVPRDRLKHAYQACGDWLVRTWQQQRDVPIRQHVKTFLAVLDPTLPERVAPSLLSALIEAYATPALRVPPRVDPDARAVMETLAARGMALGVISNIMRTPGDVLRQILDQNGLLGLFQVLTFSDECGIRKPDPEIFRLTLRQMGVQSEDAVHVGDDAILDVEGARDAGMVVVQVTPDGRSTAPVKPDAIITGLRGLPSALRRLGLPGVR